MLSVMLLAATAQGAGYYFADVGPRSMGRGAANVAGVNDLTAQYYNPAALTRLSSGQFDITLGFVSQDVRFDRADETCGAEEADCTPRVFDPVENVATPYKIPTFGVAHGLGRRDTVVGFGFHAPYAPDLSYAADGAQRYILKDMRMIQTSLGPTVAHRVNDWISLGASFFWTLVYLEEDLTVTVYADDPFQPVDDPLVFSDDPTYDVGFGLAAMDPLRFTWNAGILIEPPSGAFALGFTVQPPVTYTPRGSVEADLSKHSLYTGEGDTVAVIQQETARDEDVGLTLTMPLILKSGLLVRPLEGLEVEVDFVWQGWSSIDTVVLDDVNIPIETILPVDTAISGPIELPANYIDAWSVRLGVEYDLSDSLAMRTGGLYETSAIPDATQGVALVDGRKFGYGLGTTWTHGAFSVDVGWLQTFLEPMEITDSEVRSIIVEAFKGEVVEGKVVGNGTFTSRLDMIAAGLSWQFGHGGD